MYPSITRPRVRLRSNRRKIAIGSPGDTWSPQGFSDERLAYVESLGYDILALPEIHSKWKPTDGDGSFICGPQPVAGDPAGRVGIHLSRKAMRSVR